MAEATTDLVEALLAYISENWTRDRSIVIPQQFNRHWLDPKDSLPCLTVWKLPTPVSHTNLQANILKIPHKFKIVFRSFDPTDLQEFEDEFIRIFMLSLTSLDSNIYTISGIRTKLIEDIIDVPDVTSTGDYEYRRDINVSIFKTPSYR